MNVDVDGLRAAAEAATAGPWWTHKTPPPEMRRPGSEVCWTIHSNPQLVVSEVGLNNSEANAEFIAAVSPDVVLALLDRLQAAEAAVERVRALAWDWEQDAGPFGTDTFGIARAAKAVTAAVDGPRKHVTAPVSASGAESDHGDRREGEGLA